MLYWKMVLQTLKEGDKKTPRGVFKLGDLYYRKDKFSKLNTNLILSQLKNKRWCDDINSKNYNKLSKYQKKLNTKKFLEKIINTIFNTYKI